MKAKCFQKESVLIFPINNLNLIIDKYTQVYTLDIGLTFFRIYVENILTWFTIYVKTVSRHKINNFIFSLLK